MARNGSGNLNDSNSRHVIRRVLTKQDEGLYTANVPILKLDGEYKLADVRAVVKGDQFLIAADDVPVGRLPLDVLDLNQDNLLLHFAQDSRDGEVVVSVDSLVSPFELLDSEVRDLKVIEPRTIDVVAKALSDSEVQIGKRVRKDLESYLDEDSGYYPINPLKEEDQVITAKLFANLERDGYYDPSNDKLILGSSRFSLSDRISTADMARVLGVQETFVLNRVRQASKILGVEFSKDKYPPYFLLYSKKLPNGTGNKFSLDDAKGTLYFDSDAILGMVEKGGLEFFHGGLKRDGVVYGLANMLHLAWNYLEQHEFRVPKIKVVEEYPLIDSRNKVRDSGEDFENNYFSIGLGLNSDLARQDEILRGLYELEDDSIVSVVVSPGISGFSTGVPILDIGLVGDINEQIVRFGRDAFLSEIVGSNITEQDIRQALDRDKTYSQLAVSVLDRLVELDGKSVITRWPYGEDPKELNELVASFAREPFELRPFDFGEDPPSGIPGVCAPSFGIEPIVEIVDEGLRNDNLSSDDNSMNARSLIKSDISFDEKLDYYPIGYQDPIELKTAKLFANLERRGYYDRDSNQLNFGGNFVGLNETLKPVVAGKSVGKSHTALKVKARNMTEFTGRAVSDRDIMPYVLVYDLKSSRVLSVRSGESYSNLHDALNVLYSGVNNLESMVSAQLIKRDYFGQYPIYRRSDLMGERANLLLDVWDYLSRNDFKVPKLDDSTTVVNDNPLEPIVDRGDKVLDDSGNIDGQRDEEIFEANSELVNLDIAISLSQSLEQRLVNSGILLLDTNEFEIDGNRYVLNQVVEYDSAARITKKSLSGMEQYARNHNLVKKGGVAAADAIKIRLFDDVAVNLHKPLDDSGLGTLYGAFPELILNAKDSLLKDNTRKTARAQRSEQRDTFYQLFDTIVSRYVRDFVGSVVQVDCGESVNPVLGDQSILGNEGIDPRIVHDDTTRNSEFLKTDTDVEYLPSAIGSHGPVFTEGGILFDDLLDPEVRVRLEAKKKGQPVEIIDGENIVGLDPEVKDELRARDRKALRHQGARNKAPLKGTLGEVAGQSLNTLRAGLPESTASDEARIVSDDLGQSSEELRIIGRERISSVCGISSADFPRVRDLLVERGLLINDSGVYYTYGSKVGGIKGVVEELKGDIDTVLTKINIDPKGSFAEGYDVRLHLPVYALANDISAFYFGDRPKKQIALGITQRLSSFNFVTRKTKDNKPFAFFERTRVKEIMERYREERGFEIEDEIVNGAVAFYGLRGIPERLLSEISYSRLDDILKDRGLEPRTPKLYRVRYNIATTHSSDLVLVDGFIPAFANRARSLITGTLGSFLRSSS
ncbi:hypothetical protein J4216_05700 [Candidatus Woesearchaeota archaeon]|nr:hypothetical protein [Candidatus Woesearchaeota archaeon]